MRCKFACTRKLSCQNTKLELHTKVAVLFEDAEEEEEEVVRTSFLYLPYETRDTMVGQIFQNVTSIWRQIEQTTLDESSRNGLLC